MKPTALIVFLENIGHIHGLNLPQWVMNCIDFVTEEYAKILLRIYGAHDLYDQIIILEDEATTAERLVDALIETSQSHQVDLLLLVHGHKQCLVGYQGSEYVGMETFNPLIESYQQDPSLLDIRMVYGVNCHGITLAPIWTALGAKAVNGAAGVNWMPEPSLSVFLRHWLHGSTYSESVYSSNRFARRVWGWILPPSEAGDEHPAIASSRQVVFGQTDVTINTHLSR
ncbi:hypothetical protein KFU94_19925 [Chloroflexi bacterium TSY]|nr:hypothetical protein [Chloroflexi bacterium TSY]